MHGAQARKADGAVKRRKHAVEVVYNIIPCIKHMAGIKAYAQAFRLFYPVDDRAQLLKSAAHLAPFSCHGFKQHCGFARFRQNGIERFCDPYDPRLHPLLYMAAWMEIIKIARQFGKPS